MSTTTMSPKQIVLFQLFAVFRTDDPKITELKDFGSIQKEVEKFQKGTTTKTKTAARATKTVAEVPITLSTMVWSSTALYWEMYFTFAPSRPKSISP